MDSTPQPDCWDELQHEADLLALAIASQVLVAKHQENAPPPQEPWDNERVARERRAKWQAVDDRQRASRRLTTMLRDMYPDQGRRSA